jgi:hypothetical protein
MWRESSTHDLLYLVYYCSVRGRAGVTVESEGQLLIYQTQDVKLRNEVRLEAESVWLSQQHMATPFQTSKQNVSLHLRNIIAEGELDEDSVVKESLTTAANGKNYRTKLYRLIQSRADSKQPNMGLTNWRGAKVRKQDVTIAKNYLSEEELASLKNLVEQYLIFAEGQAMRRAPMHMKDWITKLHGFLTLNDRAVLTHTGKVSHDLAKELAETEYEKFHVARIKHADLAGSDFDEAIKQLPAAKPRRRGDKS